MAEPKIKNPFEAVMKAEENYMKEWIKFSDNYHKLYDYIKPFIEQNNEYKEIVNKINVSLITLPVSHMVINTLHMTNTKIMRDMTRASIPPLKLECPKCKTLVWDVSKIKDFLDPEGKIYGKNK